MDKRDEKLKRLLRAASGHTETSPDEMPFGFDTRVLAQLRAQSANGRSDFWELARVFRRITLGAAIVALCASSAAYWQLAQNNQIDESAANAYALADTAIETGAFQ